MRLNKLNPRDTLAFPCFLVSENGDTMCESLDSTKLRNATAGFKEFCHIVIRVGEG